MTEVKEQGVEVVRLPDIEEAICSYESTIQSVDSVCDVMHLIVSRFETGGIQAKQEIEKTNGHVRELLAQNAHLRKKDFDAMMEPILATQREQEQEVDSLLKGYLDDHRSMAESLKEHLREFRDSLVQGNADRIREFRGLMADILRRQEERKREVASKLRDYQRQQFDSIAKLKQLLRKGEDLRIKDVKGMLRQFKAEGEERLNLQKKRKEEVTEMLASYRRERQGQQVCCS